MFVNELTVLLGSMLAGKRVRVIAVRQQTHLHRHTLLQQHLGTTGSCMNARLITIIKQYNIIGETVQDVNLVLAEGGTRVGHHILHPTLVHGNHIGITLYHIDAVLLHNGLLSLEDAIELTLLVEYLRVRGVDVLLRHALGA